MAELLLAHGANPSADDGITGYTALHCAAEYGCPQMARWLLAHGADANARLSPFGVTPLHLAAMNGHLEVVTELLAAGADLSAATRDGETPLGNALFMGHHRVAEALRR